MTEKTAEYFIPGEDEIEQTQSLIDFNINDARIAEVAEQYKGIDAYKNIEGAKAAKRVLTKMRTTLSEAHKEQKAESLAFGRRLDAEKRRLLELIAPIEDPITQDLDDIKNAEARKEEQRIAEIEGFMDILRDYGTNLEGLELNTLQRRQESLNAEEVTEDIFQEFRESAAGAKAEAESRIRLAISKRQAYEEEQARLEQQRKEQEARQAELDKRERQMTEASIAALERQKKEERIEREKVAQQVARQQAELDKQAEEQAEEQAAIQKKLDDAAAAEQAQLDAAAAIAREAELAPDKAKLIMLATMIANLDMPTVKSEEGQGILSMVTHSLATLCKTIRDRTGEME